VPHLRTLCFDIPLALWIDWHSKWYSLCDREIEPAQAFVLGRVVRHQVERPDAQIFKHLRAYAILAVIDRKTQINVRLHGVATAVLQVVCTQLVAQPNTSTFMPSQVDDYTSPFVLNLAHRCLKLLPAIAARAPEDVAGEAL